MCMHSSIEIVSSDMHVDLVPISKRLGISDSNWENHVEGAVSRFESKHLTVIGNHLTDLVFYFSPFSFPFPCVAVLAYTSTTTAPDPPAVGL